MKINQFNENYMRYGSMTAEAYNKKSLSYYLMRKPCDKVILSYLKKLKGYEILEVGAGYGYYTKYILKNNNVEVADVNPQMCQQIGVPVYECKAECINECTEKKYDYVLSFFMTEYLDKNKMKDFLSNGCELLKPGGYLTTTVISNEGLGRGYIFGAHLKGINKFNYSINEIQNCVRDIGKVRIIKMNTIIGIPFAFLVEIQKSL